jgi:hypothetical protein
MSAITTSSTLQAIHRDLQAISEKAARVSIPVQVDEAPSPNVPTLSESLIGIKVDELSIRANVKVLQHLNTIEEALLDIIA